MTRTQAHDIVTIFFTELRLTSPVAFIVPTTFLEAEKKLGKELCKVIYDIVNEGDL